MITQDEIYKPQKVLYFNQKEISCEKSNLYIYLLEIHICLAEHVSLECFRVALLYGLFCGRGSVLWQSKVEVTCAYHAALI